MSKLITPEMILSWNCCEDYTEEILQKLCKNKNGLTALEILDLKITSDDKLWVLLRTKILSDKLLRLFAADCAENVLHLFEEKYPEDKRPRLAIEAARKFAHGKITGDELRFAKENAYATARVITKMAAWTAMNEASVTAAEDAYASSDAAWAASGAAVDAAVDAAHEASCTAARAVSWAVSWTAERNWQVKKLRELILEMPEKLL